MVEVPTWVIVLIGVALIIVIAIEAREYNKYVKAVMVVHNASKAVNGLAAGMQVTFEQITSVINPMIDSQNELIIADKIRERRLELIDMILDTHTDILNMRMLSEIAYKEREEIGRNKNGDGAILGT